MEDEIWKSITNYPDCEVSNFGRVKTAKTGYIKSQFKPHPNSKHLYVDLKNTNTDKHDFRAVHRLVAEAFIDNPNNYYTVSHINGDIYDNRAVNLTWGAADEYEDYEGEIWKPLNELDDPYIGYKVSSRGRVASYRDYHNHITETRKILKPYLNLDGYLTVSVCNSNHQRIIRRVHRLVANAFFGNHPDLVVNHIDGNKINNDISNLEFVTPQMNSAHASQNGLYLTKSIKIVETGEEFSSIRECAEAIGVHPSTISHCLSGRDDNVKGLHFERIEKAKIAKPFLFDYQKDAVERLSNGKILVGTVGSGKSRTALYYWFNECGGSIDEYGYEAMTDPCDLYIITTAKKRDSLEWEGELANFLLSTDSSKNSSNGYVKIVIDSWNNIGKYRDVQNAFFLLDEQRLVSYGSWTKSFLKIAKNNQWILASATPADSYVDLLPVFLANNFFKNKSEFYEKHVIFSRFTKYPKIDGFVSTTRLDRLRDRVIVQMNYEHKLIMNHHDVYCSYDLQKYKDTIRNRWDYYKNAPIEQASGLCYSLRRIVNTDESRVTALLEILEDHPKAIIFYNFNYELELLRHIFWDQDAEDIDRSPMSFEVGEWNGSLHQPVPTGDRWVYLCQYTAASEGWQNTSTDTIIFFSQNYSYKVMTQAAGRISRLNTPFPELYYYHLKSRSGIDLAISKALQQKKKFNERKFAKWD